MSTNAVNITYIDSIDRKVSVSFGDRGLSGYSGASTSGYSGWSGVSGYSGSGVSGWSGTSGYSGNIGPGDTGGVGSAGAGNQYVTLTINGVTYKLLHDGVI